MVDAVSVWLPLFTRHVDIPSPQSSYYQRQTVHCNDWVMA